MSTLWLVVGLVNSLSYQLELVNTVLYITSALLVSLVIIESIISTFFFVSMGEVRVS